MEPQIVKVLLVEDDEDDYIIVRDLLADIKKHTFTLDWMGTFDEGLRAMLQNRHDVCLVDYRLGARNGVELLSAAVAGGCQSPIIVLTGLGEQEVDLAAMKAGAADYLVKGRLDSQQLERSIRYAIERKRSTAQAAFEQARLAAFGADVGLALTRSATLDVILEDCAKAMAQYLNGALTQICVYDPKQQVMEPRASAGPIFDASDATAKLPALSLTLDELSQGKPIFIKTLAGDARMADQAWVERHDLASYAGYPLMLENRLVGLMSLFSQQPLGESTLQEMGSVANGIALCLERKRSAEALDASEDKYRLVVENIREIIFQMNEFAHWTFLNPAWTQATGFSVEETLGTFFLDYVHHDDREQNQHIFLQLIDRKMDYCRFETRLLTKDGTVRWVEVFAQVTLNHDGTILGTSGSLNDITERKKAEIQIQKLAAFPRVNPNPVLEFAADGTLSYFNDAAQQMAKSLGVDDVAALLPANANDTARECLASGRNLPRQEFAVGGRTLTWSFFPISASQVVHCYGADVTDIVSLETQFRHAQKLESVGQLAAGVAHDFNNILTVIQGYTDCLLMQCKDDNSIVSQLNQIYDAAKRATALTRQLLTFSRKQVIQPKILDLNVTLQNLHGILSRLLGEDIKLQASLGANLPSVQADAGMLEQVVMNLVVNARDAMPKGGQLQITTSVVDVDAAHASRQLGARPGQFVCLQVTDTGIGMDEQTLERIFEPFFSTKEAGKGTGLGLATVYGIVKQHQGWIEVTSKAKTGTTFKIFLPAVPKPVAPPPPSPDTTIRRRPAPGGQETIMVVEDERDLRELVCEILQGYKYNVVDAANGAEALEVWEKHNGRIDLLLTDIVMPEGMDGYELATHLCKKKPGLKVIYTSGYNGAMAEAGQRNAPFLAKPYRPAALGELIRATLNGAAQK